MAMNVVAIMGRITHDLEIKTTNSGTDVCSFTVAVDRSYSGKDGNRETDFLDVVAWRSTAQFVHRYFRKGQMIAVHGQLQTRNWEDKNGNKRKAVEIVATDVSFCGGKDSAESGRSENRGNSGAVNAIPDSPPAQDYKQGSFNDYLPADDYDDDLPF